MTSALQKVSEPRAIEVGGLVVQELVGVEQGIEWGTLFEVRFAPGAEVPWHIHTYDEVGVAREGVIEISIGHETFRPEAGELVVIPANTPHAVRVGDAPATHLAIAHTRSDAMHDRAHTILVDGPDGKVIDGGFSQR